MEVAATTVFGIGGIVPLYEALNLNMAAGPGPHGLDGTHMHSTQAPARAHRCVHLRVSAWATLGVCARTHVCVCV